MKNFARRIIHSLASLVPVSAIESAYQILSKSRLIRKLVNNLVSFFIPEKIRLGNLDLYLNQNDAVVSGSIAFGVYEKFETEIFLEKLSPGMTVLDIGANIGYYTLLASPKVKKVIAFEPDSANFEYLRRNIGANNIQNVVYYKLAVAGKTGKTKLYKNPDNYGDRRIYNFSQGGFEESVSTVALDEFAMQNDFGQIDLIKMDIQGAEGIALAGMQKILNQPSLTMFIEFFPLGLQNTGTDPVLFLENLVQKGFTIYHLNQSRKKLEQIQEFEKFVSELTGSRYTNLYCVKSQ